jgi:hypothetical protein
MTRMKSALVGYPISPQGFSDDEMALRATKEQLKELQVRLLALLGWCRARLAAGAAALGPALPALGPALPLLGCCCSQERWRQRQRPPAAPGLRAQVHLTGACNAARTMVRNMEAMCEDLQDLGRCMSVMARWVRRRRLCRAWKPLAWPAEPRRLDPCLPSEAHLMGRSATSPGPTNPSQGRRQLAPSWPAAANTTPCCPAAGTRRAWAPSWGSTRSAASWPAAPAPTCRRWATRR